MDLSLSHYKSLSGGDYFLTFIDDKYRHNYLGIHIKTKEWSVWAFSRVESNVKRFTRRSCKLFILIMVVSTPQCSFKIIWQRRHQAWVNSAKIAWAKWCCRALRSHLNGVSKINAYWMSITSKVLGRSLSYCSLLNEVFAVTSTFKHWCGTYHIFLNRSLGVYFFPAPASLAFIQERRSFETGI